MILQALHSKGIVHRDIKPQNVLLTDSNRAKVSDMGLSKTIAPHISSFDSLGASGSSGWQAPEQIRTLATPHTPKASTPQKGGVPGSPFRRNAPGDLNSPGVSPTAGGNLCQSPDESSGSPRKGRDAFEYYMRKRVSEAGSGVSSTGGGRALPTPARQSKATDVFSLGLVLYWTLTRGEHPFGMDRYERDGNILLRDPDLSALSDNPELQNLLEAMLQRCAPSVLL